MASWVWVTRSSGETPGWSASVDTWLSEAGTLLSHRGDQRGRRGCRLLEGRRGSTLPVRREGRGSKDESGECERDAACMSRLSRQAVEDALFEVGTHEIEMKASWDGGDASRCRFRLKIIDTEAPLLICPPPHRVNVSKRMPPLSYPEVPVVRDNVDLQRDIRLTFSPPNGSDSARHFASEDTLEVLVEGTDQANNAGSCTTVVTANRCPSNSERETESSECLCKEDLYRDPAVAELVCRPCIQNSYSGRGATHPSDCICNSAYYFVPSFEGLGGSSAFAHLSHNDPLTLFTKGTCKECPLNSTCSGERLSASQVYGILRGIREGSKPSARRLSDSQSGPSTHEAGHARALSPLRYLGGMEAQRQEETLRRLLAHPRPVPHRDFSLAQRWPDAVVVPCPFEGTCSPSVKVVDGKVDLENVKRVQTEVQNDGSGTVCAEGHEGPLCSERETGRQLLRRGTEVRCRQCPGAAQTIGAAFGLFLLLIVVVVIYTIMVTKDNPKMDVPEFAIAVKILTVFGTSLGFLALLSQPVFIGFREELALQQGGASEALSSTVLSHARVALSVLDFLRSIPTVGEVFSMKCLFDLFERSTGENMAGREMLSLLVPLAVIGFIGAVGIVVVFSSYCKGGKEGEGESLQRNKRADTRRTEPAEGEGDNANDRAGGDVRDSGGGRGVEAGVMGGEGETRTEESSRNQSAEPDASFIAYLSVRRRFLKRLYFSQRFVGIFRKNFDAKTGCWPTAMIEWARVQRARRHLKRGLSRKGASKSKREASRLKKRKERTREGEQESHREGQGKGKMGLLSETYEALVQNSPRMRLAVFRRQFSIN
uniref:HYR domain-containing protein n=1 Tax=Chromera velia CCMP2878 TaxID=1169474 RepID=A0A0G4IFK6_9ALVE|eukprot:Cvel_2476.t1-p1 / transcript=Cvel_2476.t1 / gene=Cvel_2476 / organism=Chromera_velia_CCMP2878 / gene_product=hypothetical protein / transcript_product=hypothetical protein / location=Cvel_scaffold97:81181-84961(-) / protein_length=825 / sequence_SO=supercontig / SO=protein_coding / is_pseudo=false